MLPLQTLEPHAFLPPWQEPRPEESGDAHRPRSPLVLRCWRGDHAKELCWEQRELDGVMANPTWYY